MAIPYTPEYWNEYYGGRYEDTCMFGLSNVQRLLRERSFKSFLDIGCGPGQSLAVAQKILGPDALVYGIEIQPIPEARRIPDTMILTADFLTCLKRGLPKVDFVYATCSMYIPWDEQDEFLEGALLFAKDTIAFGNVYDTHQSKWPRDILRKISYPSIPWFVGKIREINPDFVYDAGSADLTVFRRQKKEVKP